ncbi:MAG: hypothetical protein EOO12_08820 [Chitinophagaceae bacterium]|nr:MAG: hypothetical protein EOO12_08820 [Chitinophagaceae bacterium]RYZ18785.1 MAG: hypothetical protein EOO16_21615 [Chitinophagaceae bacterium]
MRKQPTPLSRKQLVLFGSLWLVGVALLIVAQTDLFRESLFQRKNLSVFLLVLLAPTSMLLAQVVAYRKRKQRNDA